MPSRRLAALPVLFAVLAHPSFAREVSPDEAAVRERDRAFWTSYNACDVAGMSAFFTDDVEFYHDRGGATLGKPALVEALRANLCGNADSRLRRGEVAGTVELFPLWKEDRFYGAVLSGEHTFDIVEKGRPPRRDGRARFVHLWLVRDGVWRMSRVLSYDHGPAVR